MNARKGKGVFISQDNSGIIGQNTRTDTIKRDDTIIITAVVGGIFNCAQIVKSQVISNIILNHQETRIKSLGTQNKMPGPQV